MIKRTIILTNGAVRGFEEFGLSIEAESNRQAAEISFRKFKKKGWISKECTTIEVLVVDKYDNLSKFKVDGILISEEDVPIMTKTSDGTWKVHYPEYEITSIELDI